MRVRKNVASPWGEKYQKIIITIIIIPHDLNVGTSPHQICISGLQAHRSTVTHRHAMCESGAQEECGRDVGRHRSPPTSSSSTALQLVPDKQLAALSVA